MPGGANIIHTVAVKMHVSGTGNLDMILRGLNNVIEEERTPFIMEATPFREKLRLCNFVSEYTKLRISTDEINEVFNIDRITFFIKPLYAAYPGTD